GGAFGTPPLSRTPALTFPFVLSLSKYEHTNPPPAPPLTAHHSLLTRTPLAPHRSLFTVYRSLPRTPSSASTPPPRPASATTTPPPPSGPTTPAKGNRSPWACRRVALNRLPLL